MTVLKVVFTLLQHEKATIEKLPMNLTNALPED